MKPTKHVLILHAAQMNANLRRYLCLTGLDLSNALSAEVELAGDPTTIVRWMQTDEFHAFWKACLFPPGAAELPPAPRHCWYLEALSGDRVELSVTAFERTSNLTG